MSIPVKYLIAFVAIVLLFVIVGPVAGANILALIPFVLFYAYVIGTIPAAIAGAVFAAFMLLTYDRNEPENTLGWRFGLLVGGAVGLFAMDILVSFRSHIGAGGEVSAIVFMICGGIGGAFSGGLAKHVVRPILNRPGFRRGASS